MKGLAIDARLEALPSPSLMRGITDKFTRRSGTTIAGWCKNNVNTD